MSDAIDRFIERYREMQARLKELGEISFAIDLTEQYKKTLLLSCASYYEARITDAILLGFEKCTSSSELLSFARHKGVERQYHTFFDWDPAKTRNINKFLSIFGDNFKRFVSDKINNGGALKSQMVDFLTIGYERNKMVHENFMEYKLEKTFDEIASLHKGANEFVDFLAREIENLNLFPEDGSPSTEEL